jgi:hypothetical protein
LFGVAILAQGTDEIMRNGLSRMEVLSSLTFLASAMAISFYEVGK